MSGTDPSRRDFVATTGSAFGGAWLARLAPLLAAAQACARDTRDADGVLQALTEREAATFEAFAARIVPSDDTPGAREAGVVGFADRAFATFLADVLPVVRAGLAGLDERAGATDGAFAALAEAEQDRLISEVERDEPNFFFFARSIVMLGLLAHPSYGGNRDHVGWQLIGFEDRFVYQPPFGYYDRDEHGSGSTGGA